jgi:DNA-binding XRE family transcriptional regulator
MTATLSIPPGLLARYQTGRMTAKAVAEELGVRTYAVLRALHALGIDTSKGLHQRRRLARQVEAANGLAPGTAADAVAGLYREGNSLRAVAARLRIDYQAARRLLHREAGEVRPRLHRSVFHGRPREQAWFAAELLRLREARRWSQKALGRRCAVSGATIGDWERQKEGPSWEALRRLAQALGVSLRELGVTWPPPS